MREKVMPRKVSVVYQMIVGTWSTPAAVELRFARVQVRFMLSKYAT